MPAGLITGLRGVDLGVPDVAAHVRFYTGTWRLAVAAERDGTVYLRGTGGYHHILSLRPRDKAALLCINLAAGSRADVDRLHQRARDAGAAQIDAPAAIREPGGGYGFSLVDPATQRRQVALTLGLGVDAFVFGRAPSVISGNLVHGVIWQEIVRKDTWNKINPCPLD